MKVKQMSYSSESNEQLIFEEEMMKEEQKMAMGDEKGGKRKKSGEIKGLDSDDRNEQREIESKGLDYLSPNTKQRMTTFIIDSISNQVHENNTYDNAPSKKIREKIDPNREIEINRQIFRTQKKEADDFKVLGREPNDIMYSELKDSIFQYKRSTKCLFVGDLLNQCSVKRRETDKWYFWNKEMIQQIDKYEETMTLALLANGHENIGNLMNEHGGEEWNMTLENKIENLIDGLKSVEEMINEEGMTTVWGILLNKGIVHNRIKSSSKKGKRKTLMGYVRHKCKRWESHYKKVQDKLKCKNLYF